MSSTESAKPSKLPPFDATDPLGIDDLLGPDDLAIRDTVRTWAADRVLPHIAEWYEKGELPGIRELARELGALGALGMSLEGYGCAGASAVQYGLACLELEAADSGIRSLVSVQGSLAMYAIHRYGSEEQRQRWLPGMAAGETIGCFGLTEPDHGSDPAGMRTYARRDGEDWILTGRKMWITNGSVAGVAVVWAQTDEGEDGRGVRGFVVPTDAPGFSAPEIRHKWSLRASVTSELVMDEVRLPADAVLPDAKGLRGPLSCLSHARYGIVWGSMGAARASFEAALDYARGREQFGRPIGGFQLTQAETGGHGAGAAQGHPARPPPRPPDGRGGAPAGAGQLRQAQQRAGGHRDLPHRAHDPGGQRDLAGVPGDAARDEPGVGAHLRGDRGDAPAGAGQGAHRSRRLPVTEVRGSARADRRR
ncbi:Crotonobetainyl-CoA reductase [Streptomyces californicus]